MTLTPGADWKSFSHDCKEYIAVQVGEVSSNNLTDRNTHRSSMLLLHMSDSQQVIK